MENGTLPDRRSFTKAMVGKDFQGRPFKVVKRFTNLEIQFKWSWQYYQCENCNHVKQEIVTHLIHTVEMFEPIKIHDDEVTVIQVWLGHAKDGGVLNIPQTRLKEVLDQIKA